MGTSFAAKHLKAAAKWRGLKVTDSIKKATLIFVSEDTPTDKKGRRNLKPIRALIEKARSYTVPIILTSQVPPGFTRSLGSTRIWHQAETLRIKDAEQRAIYPEQIIVGGPWPVPEEYLEYLQAFHCLLSFGTWEDAEFSKIAINMTLASQVENANRLSKAANKCGASWLTVMSALGRDGRIGQKSYITPGRWQNSKHLLRDHVTLREIENG
jgi:UDP-glucose 6-dehydrogenase